LNAARTQSSGSCCRRHGDPAVLRVGVAWKWQVKRQLSVSDADCRPLELTVRLSSGQTTSRSMRQSN
jgi:hypothetical protein